MQIKLIKFCENLTKFVWNDNVIDEDGQFVEIKIKKINDVSFFEKSQIYQL